MTNKINTTDTMLENALNTQASSVSDKLSFDFKSCNSEEAAENYDRGDDADFADWADAEFGGYWEGAETISKATTLV